MCGGIIESMLEVKRAGLLIERVDNNRSNPNVLSSG